jgi:hypothetical protein
MSNVGNAVNSGDGLSLRERSKVRIQSCEWIYHDKISNGFASTHKLSASVTVIVGLNWLVLCKICMVREPAQKIQILLQVRCALWDFYWFPRKSWHKCWPLWSEVELDWWWKMAIWSTRINNKMLTNQSPLLVLMLHLQVCEIGRIFISINTQNYLIFRVLKYAYGRVALGDGAGVLANGVVYW